MVNLKRIVSEDEFEKGIKALISIFIEEYPYFSTWISNNMYQFKNGEKQILGIEKKDGIVGYLMIHFCTFKIVKINGIYIFDEFSNQGVATAAINELINKLTKLFIDLIYIQTRLDNNSVVHLFDKTNFQLIGTNFHEVENKNNWVACHKINSSITNEQEIAQKLYKGFLPLKQNEIISLRNEHKNTLY